MRYKNTEKLAVGISLFVLACAVPAKAQKPEPDALRKAIAAFDRGEMEKAEKLLASALAGTGKSRLRARAHMYLGIAQANRQAMGLARESFRKALQEDSKIAPDPERVPPSILKEFKRVRKTVRATLIVEASERGARIFIDGKDIGAAPLTAKVTLGPHKVHALSADRDRKAKPRTIDVQSKPPTKIRLQLEAREGKLILAMNAAGKASTGGRVLGEGMTIVAKMTAGVHRIEITASDHYPASKEVRVPPEGTVEVRVDLAPVPSWFSRRRNWGWVSLGVSAAALVSGLFVGRSASSADDAIASGQNNATLSYDRFQQLSEAAKSNARWANVLFGLSAASAVTATILLVIGDKDAPKKSAWRIVPTAGGLAVAGRF